LEPNWSCKTIFLLLLLLLSLLLLLLLVRFGLGFGSVRSGLVRLDLGLVFGYRLGLGFWFVVKVLVCGLGFGLWL
jgi:hypothetical protein